MKILVTGIAGDIGQGIGKILKTSGIAEYIVGCDIHNEHPGAVFFDVCEIVERADSRNYIQSLLKIAKNHRIDLIIPTSEPELRFLLQQDLLDNLDGIPLLTANKQALVVGFDKLETAIFLKSVGLPYPWTHIVKAESPSSFPCIIKSRGGAGGKDVALVLEDLVELYSRIRPLDIWQEYLQPDDQEYTCGVFRSSGGDIRTIIFKRKLSGGITVYGEVKNNSEIDLLIGKLAQELDLAGSINIQLRLTANGPVIFEINPRFSSTVVFRHRLGFQDVIWAIDEKMGKPLTNYIPPKAGTKFYRGTNEFIFE